MPVPTLQKLVPRSGGALEDWNAYLERYYTAKAEKSTLDYLLQKCEQWEQTQDFSPAVFDDTDCLHRLSRERFDLVALCCVLLLTIPVFMQEYTGGSADLLRTMRRGLLPLCAAKLALAASYGFGVSMLLFAVRNVCIPVQNGGAALQNLLSYTGFGGTTIRQYLLQNALLHAAEWAIAAVGICMIYALCRSTVPALFLAAFALIVPAYTLHAAPYLFAGAALRSTYQPGTQWALWMLCGILKLTFCSLAAYRGWRRK